MQKTYNPLFHPPHFQCSSGSIFGFGEKASIAIKFVLKNKLVKNYWQKFFSSSLLCFGKLSINSGRMGEKPRRNVAKGESIMKKYFVLLSALLLIYACNTKPKEYPNTKTDQIVNQLKWGLNYSSVKNILTEEYKLVLLKEIEQNDKLTKVYEFSGGKYNNIESKSWVVAFNNDSLFSIMIKISKEQPSENKKIYKNLCDLNNKELKKDSGNRWYLEEDGIKLSEILITTSPKNEEITIVIMRAQ